MKLMNGIEGEKYWIHEICSQLCNGFIKFNGFDEKPKKSFIKHDYSENIE